MYRATRLPKTRALPDDAPPRRRKRRILGAVLVALAALVVLVNWTWGNLPSEPPRSGNEAQLGDVRVRYVEHPGNGTRSCSSTVFGNR